MSEERTTIRIQTRSGGRDEGDGLSAAGETAEVLNDLRKCQRDIVALRHKCDRQIDEIERSYAESVKPYLTMRSGMIEGIPKFWSKSLLNHPLLSTVFEPGESDVLSYLSNLEVEEDPRLPDYFKIIFSFRKNPYFENRTLTKEFRENGSVNTHVRWRKGQMPFPKVTDHERWEDDDLGLEYKGFFRWYFDPNEHYCDPIADIIKTCIWYNPLEFFDRRMMVHAGAGGRVIDKGPDYTTLTMPPTQCKMKATKERDRAGKKPRKPSSRSEN